ncbi:hypothetical protein IMZ48_38910 [Candidatus Bathyarchaeota archaeon]|nr:hypothetical protein [Candidatus Bathyarchaeota archaeon]
MHHPGLDLRNLKPPPQSISIPNDSNDSQTTSPETTPASRDDPPMAARSAAASVPRGVFAPRTVFVRVLPAPLSLAERRAVLHALKRHCRIDFFRKIQVS